MRGSITLDLILALVLLIATTSSFFFLAYTQIENTMIASTQYKAEAMAMSVGSAMNHFAAVKPAGASELILEFEPPENPGFAIDIGTCTVKIFTVQKFVQVDMLVYRMDSSQPERLISRYPITLFFDSDDLGGIVSTSCDKGIRVWYNTDKLEVDAL